MNDYTVKDLKNLAREKGVKGYSKLRKDELCNILNIECEVKPKSKSTSEISKIRKVNISKTTQEKLKEPKTNKTKEKKPSLPTINEMKKMAREKKLSNYSNLDKQGLCKLLDIDCGDFQKRKVYKYTKSQLIEMASSKNLKGLHKLSVVELCNLLNIECEEIKPKKKLKKEDIKRNIKKRIANKGKNKKIFKKTPIKKDKSIFYKKKNIERQREILTNRKNRINEKKQLEELENKRNREMIQKEFELMNKIRLSKNYIERSIKPLREHQIKAIKMAKGDKKGLIIGHEVGTGKSLTGWTIVEGFVEEKHENRAIIVVPKSVIPGFIKTATNDYGSKFNFYIETGRNKAESIKYDYINKVADFVELNGERLPKIMIIGKEQFTIMFKNKNPEYLSRYFKHCGIVIDEAHNLRGGKNKTHFSVILNCCKYARKVILLTGTPIYNNLYDYANLIALINGEEAIEEDEYYNMVDINSGHIKNNKESKKYFSCNVSIFKYGLDNVNFPKSKVIMEKVDMTDEIYYLYRKKENDLKKNAVKNMESGAMTFLTGLRTGLTEILPKDNPKYIRIKNILLKQYKDGEKEEKGSGERKMKSIIFSQFKGKGIDSVSKILNKKVHCNVRKYTGDTSIEDRDKLVREFNNDEFNILLITKAGGEGLDLRGVRNVFILEGPWNDSTIEQVAARGIRYLSHSHLPEEERFVNIYYMCFLKPPKDKRNEIFDRMSKNDPDFISLSAEDQEELRNGEKLEISADEKLFKISEEKAKFKENFMKDLVKFSIESNKC